jgi:hypothetical protein
MLSCTKQETVYRNDNFYEALNELLKAKYHDSGIVILDLFKVHGDSIVQGGMFIDFEGDTLYPPPPPLPPGYINYDMRFLAALREQNLLDSIDVDYMYDNIDSCKNYVLDSTKIKRPVYKGEIIEKMGKGAFYKLLRDQYKSTTYVQVSTPLISRDGNKMIITVEHACGGLCGGGQTYLLQKTKDKWNIIYSHRNWIS